MLLMRGGETGLSPHNARNRKGGARRIARERSDGGGNDAKARRIRDARGVSHRRRRKHDPAGRSGRSDQENLTDQ